MPRMRAGDGWTGLKSCDPLLQNDVNELLLFFNTHNTRPLLGCRVHGWHHETRHRRVRVGASRAPEPSHLPVCDASVRRMQQYYTHM